jgi:hypothetical protein
MSSFVPRATPPTLAEPDPTKHVKYTLGMVLGVDDFTQEFAYLAGRDQWLAREIIGYGTASGLRVTVEVEQAAPQVLVTPGVAVSPRGQLIRVAPSQCADLNLWLQSRREELGRRLASVVGNRAQLRLYVVLGYRECATDMVPIPGEPCRSQEETMAPSRLADDFRLELRFDAPEQSEEDALRDFVEWLSQVEVTDEPGGSATLEELEQAIRRAARLDEQTPASPPDFFHGSPPEALRIHPSMAYEYLRAAFRLWVTELRPRWQAWRAAGNELDTRASGSGEEDGVLLADLSVPVARASQSALWQVENAAAVGVHEERRPYLVHLRMLQELVVSGRRAGGGATSGGASIGPAFSVVPETAFDQTASAGKRFDYARADHTHGTPPTPVLGGDVTGRVGSTTVAAIRNREIDQAAPAENQVLTFRNGKWRPAAPPAAPAQGASAAADVVTRPPGLPAYRTVAAGLLPIVEGPAANTYNNLRVTRAGGGLVTLNFNGYQQPARPNPTQMYVVKALPAVAADAAVKAPSVAFVRFDDNASGFTLLVTNAGQPLEGAALAAVSLMVEVSQYDIPAGKASKETKEKDTKEGKEKDTKESKEKDTKESKEKDTKEGKEKDTKESKEKDTKEKDTKESKEKDTKESKEKDTKESKEKDTKESKEKDTKESKEKDTKESKEKDTKETKEKDTKEKEKTTKETKEKDTKETKEKDTKETKEKDTKESKEKEKDTKEAAKDTKENKENKEEKEQKDRTKEAMSLKEIERNELGGGPAPQPFTASDASVNVAGLESAAGEDAPSGRAFIREEERPAVGRRALELADREPDKPEEKQPESGVIDKQAEAVN